MIGVNPGKALSLMRPNRLPRSRPQTRFDYGKLLGLTLCILLFAGKVRGQSLIVVSGGSTVSQGGTVSINTIPNMPNLVLSVNGGTSCDAFSYQISITYTDQATPPATTGTNVTFNAQDVEGDQSSTVSWLNNFEGGNATISWTFDGVQQSTFNFFVNGTNPPNSTVDSYLASGAAPWFAQSLVAEESGAYKYAPYNQYHQFVATPYDTIWGTPDGIGLMQVEPPNRLNGNDLDFWAWSENIADGLHLLSTLRCANCTSSGPYVNWTSEYNDMIANTGGHPIPANWPSDCITPANGAACAGFGPLRTFYCSFSSGNPNGSPNGFGDANWMHAYNGFFFVTWVDAAPPATGHWEYDALGPSSGYVYNVCTSAPL